MRWAYSTAPKQPHLSAKVQSRRLYLFGHIAWMSNEADAKKILTAGQVEETTGTPSYNVVKDYSAGCEIQ